jgi:hypothetical protein
VAEEIIGVALTEIETCEVLGRSVLQPAEWCVAETDHVVTKSSCKLNRLCAFLPFCSGVGIPAHEAPLVSSAIFGLCLEAVFVSKTTKFLTLHNFYKHFLQVTFWYSD